MRQSFCGPRRCHCHQDACAECSSFTPHRRLHGFKSVNGSTSSQGSMRKRVAVVLLAHRGQRDSAAPCLPGLMCLATNSSWVWPNFCWQKSLHLLPSQPIMKGTKPSVLSSCGSLQMRCTHLLLYQPVHARHSAEHAGKGFHM